MLNGENNYRRFLDGDDQGFVEIVKEYNDSLVLFINGYVHNIHVAQEIAQDVFFNLLIKKPHYSPKNSFKTWLFTIGRNQALNVLRKKEKFLSFYEKYTQELVNDEKNLISSYVEDQDKLMLHKTIQKLTPQYSEILYLAYFEALSVKEIANITKKSVKQVSNLLYRAKKSLKDQLEKEGFQYEDAWSNYWRIIWTKK